MLESSERVELSESGLFASRWTLLGCSGSQFAQPMVDGWVAGVPAALEARSASRRSDGGSGVVELPLGLQARWLSLVDGAILQWLRRPLLASMRFSVAAERRASFLCHFGDSNEPRRKMQMHNKYFGLVCLVDGNGIVRWHVHGNEEPTAEQVDALAGIIERQAKKQPVQGPP